MKLKTLKDVGQSLRDCCSREEDYSNICEKCIKKEAIKWVKEDIRIDGGIIPRTKTWMRRFNITEEEIK
ncbi:MAG: hypothetical protein QQN41_08705 [Nitrosopumilus sp.]